MIGELGMYATLRVGPFVEAEWNFGYDLISLRIFLLSLLAVMYYSGALCRGFPYWLREVPNITFRTDNSPFKVNYALDSSFRGSEHA